MAVKMYYGTCTTAGATKIKEVYVRDLDLTEEGFEFQRGDALSVYFSHKNTNEEPSLKIMVGDTENERSIDEDSGKLVKTRSINVDAIGAWDDGETVIFVYTFNASGEDDNNYYWELVNGAPSTEEVYGVTKLFGNVNTNIKTWLQTPSEKDYTTALAPGLLKKFYDTLINDSGSMINLEWTQGKEGTNLLLLGTLKVNGDDNNSVQIKYPLQTLIQEIIDAKTLSTSQIRNDGPGNDYSTQRGHFYITNVLPNDARRVLYFNDGTRVQAFLDPNTEYGNLHLRGQNGITLNASDSNGNIADVGVGAVTCNPKFTAKSDMTINGNTNAKGITCTGLTVNGSGTVTTNLTVKGTLKGKTLYEDGVSLKTKYSGKLKVVNKRIGPITLAKNSACGHKYINLKEPGWQAIGVIGWNLDYAGPNTGDALYCYIWECIVLVGNQQLLYSIRNTRNATAVVECDFRILYVKEV